MQSLHGVKSFLCMGCVCTYKCVYVCTSVMCTRGSSSPDCITQAEVQLLFIDGVKYLFDTDLLDVVLDHLQYNTQAELKYLEIVFTITG